MKTSLEKQPQRTISQSQDQGIHQLMRQHSAPTFQLNASQDQPVQRMSKDDSGGKKGDDELRRPFPSILEIMGKKGKPGTVNALNSLMNAVRNAPLATQKDLARMDKEGSEILSRILKLLEKDYGNIKGPIDEMKNIFWDYFNVAIALGFNFDDEKVLDAFGSFLMMVVTEGFEGTEVSGTTVGNSKNDFGTFNSEKFKKK